MNTNKFDVLIVGAGPVGCVLAERFAEKINKKVLLIDKRRHIAGNCYDEHHKSGVLIHKYGPHYFRSNNENLIHYLSSFTEWIEGNYYVTVNYNKKFYPFPINRKTINQFFDKNFTTEEEVKLFIESKQIKINNPSNSEEFVLSRVGQELYNAFYLGYTLKQWNLHPSKLGPSVCGRIPIRLNEDCRYVDHKYQLTPKKGFTSLFKKMTNHKNIKIVLDKDFNNFNVSDFKIVIYTGAIDEYFKYCYGKLKWRSLNFEFKSFDQEFVQPNVQINYSSTEDFTRSVEIKHVTKQKIKNTVVSYEYPTDSGDPYYPIPNDENEEIYQKYKLLAEKETTDNNVYFCGRLAEYKYYNTDEVIEKALNLFDKIQANDK
jgi:UDP-galactopyranose mutase